MDYELKYKNALEWARQVMNGETGFIREEVVEVFPELAESEDERIRQVLIRFHKSTISVDGIKGEEILAWLEKQGNKKQAPKSKWSAEDESVLQGIWDEILANKHEAKEYDWKTYDKFLAWLNSLKKRIEE